MIFKKQLSYKIAIAATFTSEPLEESLSFWMQKLGIACQIEFAPYNQVFQQLIDPNSLLVQNKGGINIICMRLADWYKAEEVNIMQDSLEQLKQTAQEFVSTLQAAIQQAAVPYLICLCPPAPVIDPPVPPTKIFKAHSVAYKQVEEQITTLMRGFAGVHLIDMTELNAIYPVTDYHDAYGEQQGHIPYTATFFCALGTLIARKIRALHSAPYKVIVLDCDQTLWRGVCGEDGPDGVEIDPPHYALQKFIVAQQEAGKLLCLCSKNETEDVFAVFDRHSTMPLQRRHLVNWRINWQPKSANLRALADELQLGLDSFIFIDDNPLECMEMRANCPEVLTLQLPQDAAQIPAFLAHVWAFDQLNVTQEDRQRTERYQQSGQRQQLRQEAFTFADFLAKLELEIEIGPMEPVELERVAQLTQRTNQFNLTTIRRSERELQQLFDTGHLEGQIVKVRDRFGDYGLVGVLLFATQTDVLRVDTLLLSCRVLGRGVEHKLLAYLGEVAQERRLSRIDLPYTKTKKNQPALDFLQSLHVPAQRTSDESWLYQFPAAMAAGVNFQPSELHASAVDVNLATESPAQIAAPASFPATLFEEIATNWHRPDQILKAIARQNRQPRPTLATDFVAPRTPLQAMIAEAFAETLGFVQVGIDDDFFDLGGDSLHGASIINQLQAQFKEIIHFSILFRANTIAKLADYFAKNYPAAVTRLFSEKISQTTCVSSEKINATKINATKVAQLRALVPTRCRHSSGSVKNRPAVFILAPPRSGSTLLRVILGGHPQIFAPPELNLLLFNTVKEFQTAFSGADRFWQEGVLRAIMQVKQCGVEEATCVLDKLAAQNLTTQQGYHLLQTWSGGKLLVDKTPTYPLDPVALRCAEDEFENPLYIHLVRHPYGMIRSFEESKLEQILFNYPHTFARRELAELLWLVSHQNILEFLQEVPSTRQHQLYFEDLVRQPQHASEALCDFLHLNFHPDMLQPYKEQKQRMTDGIHAESRMIGDVKFHQHREIDDKIANRWQQAYTHDFLGEITIGLAAQFGYEPIKPTNELEELVFSQGSING